MIVYLALDGLHSSPFPSQILGYLSRLREAGADVRLVIWTRLTDRRKTLCQERAAQATRVFGNDAAFLNRGPNLARFSTGRWVRDVEKLLIEWGVTRSDPILFHARSPWAGRIAVQLKRHRPNARVITDFRGSMSAEVHLMLRNTGWPLGMLGKAWIREARGSESTCARLSDHLLCVSRPLKKLLKDRYGVADSRITVVPCFVDTGRFAFDPSIRNRVRSELRIKPDTLVLLYCGSLEHYNRNEEMVRIYHDLRAAGKKVVLLQITPDTGLAERTARGANIPQEDFRILRGRHDEVARWLHAGDIALLLRDRTEVNRVACPMKFAEYVRSGVKVLATPGIGDLDEFILNHSAGWFLDASGNFPEDLVTSYGNSERKRISDAAAMHFGNERHVPVVLDLYQKLMGREAIAAEVSS